LNWSSRASWSCCPSKNAGQRATVDELLDPDVHPQTQPLIGHVRASTGARVDPSHLTWATVYTTDLV
jgi:hypothetical protein